MGKKRKSMEGKDATELGDRTVTKSGSPRIGLHHLNSGVLPIVHWHLEDTHTSHSP